MIRKLLAVAAACAVPLVVAPLAAVADESNAIPRTSLHASAAISVVLGISPGLEAGAYTIKQAQSLN